MCSGIRKIDCLKTLIMVGADTIVEFVASHTLEAGDFLGQMSIEGALRWRSPELNSTKQETGNSWHELSIDLVG